jgi:putative PIN family toxin of toxin-antitoxin system
MSGDAALFRVVVDTNILIRAILSTTGASALLLDAIRQRRCVFITSREHLSELNRVLQRPRFVERYGVTIHQRCQLIARLYTLGVLVHPGDRLAICRDPQDDYLIEMALLGRATHLVSEDADLYDDPDIVEFLRQSGIQAVRVGVFVRTLATAKSSNKIGGE